MRAETVKQFRAIVQHLIAFLGHDDVAAVTTADVVRWRKHLETELTPAGKVRSPKTINDSYLAAVKALFAYAVNDLLLTKTPMDGLGKTRAEKRVKLREKDFTTAERRSSHGTVYGRAHCEI